MKPPVIDRTFESTLEGEEIALSLDQDSLVHLMNQFIDLYDDSEMAVLREYSTNAHDAHVAAGHTLPIEVTLPSAMEPTLVIRDYGIGLSHDEIRDVYSKYGASTKRDSNDFNGTLGLGCKSGLTYSDQFTLVTVKDGLRNVAAISRDSSGAGHITIVEHDTPTDEGNGVTVRIPAKRVNQFAVKAAKLFQYWPVGSVLVNGEHPSRFEGRRITDTLYLRKRDNAWRSSTDHTVVMGNVPYPFDADMLGVDLGHEHDVIVFVPIGAVEFAPNREGLRDSNLNRKALAKIGQELAARMLQAAQEDIDAAETAPDALRRAARWLVDLPSAARPKTWTWRGQELPDFFEAPQVTLREDGEDVVHTTRFTTVPYSNNKVGQHDRAPRVPFQTGCDAIWFHGFDVKFSPNHRRRLDAWHEAHPDVHSPRQYILAADKPDMTYLEADRVFDWAEVRAIKLEREVHGDNGRLIGSYDAFEPGASYKSEILAARIDAGEAVFYWAESQSKGRWATTREDKAKPFVHLIREFEPDCTVVLLPETRLRKFLQQFPDAQDIRAAVQEHFDSWVVTLTEDQRLALTIHNESADQDLRELDGEAIDDPAIIEAVRLAKIDLTDVLKRYKRFDNVGQSLSLPEWTNPLVKYPLGRWATARHYYHDPIKPKLRMRHNVIYINAVYNAAASLEGDTDNE